MIEKRRWPRARAEWEAVYTSIVRADRAGLKTSATVDVSEGGVRFRSNAFIGVGDRLRFTMRPPAAAPVEAILAAVWVREIPNLSLFEVGGHFEEMTQDSRGMLRDWTRSQQAQLVTRAGLEPL